MTDVRRYAGRHCQQVIWFSLPVDTALQGRAFHVSTYTDPNSAKTTKDNIPRIDTSSQQDAARYSILFVAAFLFAFPLEVVLL